MNEFKGTQGPWEVDGVEVRASASHPTERICEMVPGFERADADLIAAAPDLFKELQLVLDYEEQSQFERWVEIADPSGDCESVQRQWLESAEYEDFCDLWSGPIAAVAKALGK